MKDINRRDLLKLAGGLAICSENPFAGYADITAEEQIEIRWDFEGGSLKKVERVGPGSYRCHVKRQVDQDTPS